ncbi:MAG: oxidoreductase [Flavobacterium sp.]|uniref:WD40/YVTN/BNR-like repeat-containing protein n=1 Tax=Flavobacterium sp. TaxID=239 RepID=UPI0022BC3249|nr:oxidoreductase [Flavobacterium sp.]MCZ8198727.1 oxidoreductase [Flavobacterium sp.]
MRNSIFLTFFLTFIISCKSTFTDKKVNSTTISMDTLLLDKISVRAISVSENNVFYAGNKSRVGYFNLKDKSKKEIRVDKDSISLEYRSIAQTDDAIFVVNVGNPAHLYKISKDLNSVKLVYSDTNEKVFFDSMQFWNNQEGIAIGDPIDDCLHIIVTNDGGNSWHKISCDKLPKTVEGEAAFAASNTNIIVKENQTWLVSGGKKSRVFFSPDKGKTWEVYETPIVQGESMTGIFTADFCDKKNGIVAGGNFEKPTQNFQNKAITNDGGKTWKLIAENAGFGYASCIQYVPNSNGKKLVSVGATGIFNSNDKGITWKQISSDNSFYTIRFVDASTAIAAGKDKIVKLVFSN